MSKQTVSKSSGKKKSLSLKEKREKELARKQHKKNKRDIRSPRTNKLIAHYQNGQYDEAEELARSIVDKSPSDLWGWKILGVVLAKRGLINEALVANQNAIRLDPNDSSLHADVGAALNMLGRWEEAEESCKRAILLSPSFAEAHYNLGITLQELDRLEEAEANYRQAILLKPTLTDAHYNLGITLQKLDRSEEAAASYEDAIGLKPSYALAHNNLGITLQELGRLDEAEKSQRQAIAFKSDLAEAHSNLGVTLLALGRPEEAEKSQRQAIALESDYAEAHNNLGITLHELGRLDEAEENYRDAIRLNPVNADAHNNLGLTLRELDRLDESIESFKQALAIYPDHVLARMNLNTVSAAAVPEWHLPMMNDEARNNAYFNAIKLAVNDEAFVLEIGTGSGLLSLMAAANGADKIITCEASKTIADAARRIIQINGYGEQICVLNKKSTDLIVGEDLPQKADLIISEVLSAEFVGEGVRSTILDANKRLLKKDGEMIPQSGKIRVSLLGNSPEVFNTTSVANVHGFDLSKFNLVSKNKFFLHLRNKPVFLSNPEDAFSINLCDESPLANEQKIIKLQANQDGLCLGLIQWMWVHIYKNIEYENRPGEVDSHWPTPIYLFDEPIEVKTGDVLEIRAYLSEDSVWFSHLI